MGKIFEAVSNNFYNILSGSYKYMYDDIITILYKTSLANNTYTFKKDEFINIIEEYFKNNNYDFENQEELLTTTRSKATYVYRKLRECGWIDEEIGINQELLTNFEDYAITFLETWFNYNQNNSFELSSKVYGIYQTLKNFDINQGYLTLHTIVQDGKDLITKLRSLNSNIKKYIRKILNLEEKNETALLTKILKQLLSDYKVEIIDKAYYYMKTNDNPKKYQLKFNEYLRLLEENKDRKEIIINQIIKKDNVTYDVALDTLNEMFNFLENLFLEVINLVQEIDNKNTKYISVAIEKIQIILNHNQDIEGLLLNILKNFDLFDETDLKFSFTTSKTLNKDSLYVAKNYKKMTNSKLLLEEEFVDEELIRMYKEEQKYSRKNIENYIKGKLKEKDKLEISDFDISQKEEFIKLILLLIYEQSSKVYKITWFDEEVTYKNKIIKKFIIEGIRND